MQGAESERAVALLQEAVTAFTAAVGVADAERQAHADACLLLADLLEGLDRMPEAMQALQEAADSYAGVPEGAQRAGECARRIVAGVRALWRRPSERLYLLVARHERDLRQLEARPGTEGERAERLFALGRVFQRRERWAEAAIRYREALGLFGRAGDALGRARCHRRLADLYAYDMDDAMRARRHHRAARVLFRSLGLDEEGRPTHGPDAR